MKIIRRHWFILLIAKHIFDTLCHQENRKFISCNKFSFEFLTSVIKQHQMAGSNAVYVSFSYIAFPYPTYKIFCNATIIIFFRIQKMGHKIYTHFHSSRKFAEIFAWIDLSTLLDIYKLSSLTFNFNTPIFMYIHIYSIWLRNGKSFWVFYSNLIWLFISFGS